MIVMSLCYETRRDGKTLSVRVANVSGQVRETFDMTGFADIFGIGGKPAP